MICISKNYFLTAPFAALARTMSALLNWFPKIKADGVCVPVHGDAKPHRRNFCIQYEQLFIDLRPRDCEDNVYTMQLIVLEKSMLVATVPQHSGTIKLISYNYLMQQYIFSLIDIVAIARKIDF